MDNTNASTAADLPTCNLAVQLLMTRAGHLLLTRRHNTGFADDDWQAPGGRIKHDEDVLTAVIRETDEEVGVRLRRECVDMVSAAHIRSPLGDTRMRSPLVGAATLDETLGNKPQIDEILAIKPDLDLDESPDPSSPHDRPLLNFSTSQHLSMTSPRRKVPADDH
ncbi:NUDIX domain-containing protein [Nocardia brasiliensis]|uniref:NUDIX domain-containing protein n=1 Tax=Nocardia brasiliensis TaxID=37326 RepID=UPI0024552CB4|nr:NUDIX domain-containing protein [Nocardia brasiliensis]